LNRETVLELNPKDMPPPTRPSLLQEHEQQQEQQQRNKHDSIRRTTTTAFPECRRKHLFHSMAQSLHDESWFVIDNDNHDKQSQEE
jgi:hypothetical protein